MPMFKNEKKNPKDNVNWETKKMLGQTQIET